MVLAGAALIVPVLAPAAHAQDTTVKGLKLNGTYDPLRDKVASIRFRLDARTQTLAKRCADVRRFLATPNEAEYSFQWS